MCLYFPYNFSNMYPIGQDAEHVGVVRLVTLPYVPAKHGAGEIDPDGQ